jgi:hypothetical protein
MVEGLQWFADRKPSAGVARRQDRWTIDGTSPVAHARSVEPNHGRFARIIGAVGL